MSDKKMPMTDSEMPDFLERFITTEGPLLLHNDYRKPFLTARLGLLGGQRTLRQAIAQCAGRPAPK